MNAANKMGRLASIVSKFSQQKRSMSAMGVPAREKVPLLEEVLLGGIMVTGMMAYPIYILMHIKVYNGTAKSIGTVWELERQRDAALAARED